MGGRNTSELFWSRVIKTDTCWIWSRATDKQERARFKLEGKRLSVYHLSYMLTYNLPLYTKLYLCHACDNPRCVNPTHLFEGNDKINAQDMMRKGRGRGQFTKDTPTAFRKGHTPASRKISEEVARGIKMDLQTMRQCDIIRKYDLPRETVRGIARGISWASLEVGS